MGKNLVITDEQEYPIRARCYLVAQILNNKSHHNNYV